MLVWMTGEISLVSPLANILVLWVVPFTMLVGFVMIIVSLVSSIFNFPIITIAWVLLGYILTIVEWFSNIPFASIQVPQISIIIMLVVYTMYLLIWVYRKTRKAQPSG